MDDLEETFQALVIGIAVASVLLQTCRYRNAIDIFTECLVLLKRLKTENLNGFYALVFHRLFYLYCLVGDTNDAIHNGEKAIHIYHEMGDSKSAAELLVKFGDQYQLAGELVEAKERYDTALRLYHREVYERKLPNMPNIEKREHLNKMLLMATKADSKAMEGKILHQLGELALSVFDYPKAKDYFERELGIWIETGNKEGQGETLRRIGSLHWDIVEYEQAKSYYKEAVVILEEVDKIKELGEAWTDLGKVCEIRREFREAKIWQHKALEISVKTGNKYEEILNYRFLADIHTSLGECEAAKKCYGKALAISKEVRVKKGEAFTYDGLRTFYRRLNDYAMAEKYGKKALEIYTDIGDIRLEGIEKCELGDLYLFLGKYEEAVKCHERSLFIKKQIGDRRGEGQLYGNLGVVCQSMGDYSKAKQCHEQALAINRETNHLVGQGVDYGNLGTVYRHFGDYARAHEYHKKALEIMMRSDHQEAIPAEYYHLGICCQNLGEYGKAKTLWEKGLKIAREVGERSMEASILSGLAHMESIIGESEKAKALYNDALQINKEVGNIVQEAVTIGNLGTVFQLDGDISTAIKCLESSLDAMKQIGSKGGEGGALGKLGALYASLGKYDKAKTLYKQALKIARETGDKRLEMTMDNSLGNCYVYQNDLKEALVCFRKALSCCEMMGDLKGISTCYSNIGSVYAVTGDLPNVLTYLKKSIKALEKIQASIGESEYYKIGFVDQHDGPYQSMIAVLLKLGNVDLALSVAELVRARSLAELMAKQYSTAPLPEFDSSHLTHFQNVVHKSENTGLLFCFLQEFLFCWILKANRNTMISKNETEGFAENFRPQGVSIQDWLETLANQCCRHFSLLPGEQCEDRSLFLCDENIEVRSPSEVKESEEKPKAEQSPKACPVEKQMKGGQSEQPTLTLLHKIIIAPVADLLGGSELIVVPDRSLYRVPFAALMDESGKYLSEKFRIRLTPSLTTLKLIQDCPADYHSDTGVLIVGDPDVGTVVHQGKQIRFDPLPFARQEAEMIGRLLNVHPVTGKEATKQKVLQKVHSVGLIHFAAHGDVDRGNIALAPSNPEKDDFLLTMSDISNVQLRAKLVVLSCCHSGRGQIKAEGVVGIARAFLGSGARSVLVSLWAVDDETTMQFMKQFYIQLVRGKSASKSLHETMKWMRGNPKYCEVRKWAPFMLIGDDVSFKFAK